jgi:hypothetical protein
VDILGPLPSLSLESQGGTDPGSPSRTAGSALVGIPAEGCGGDDRDHGADHGDVGGPGRAQHPREVRPARYQPCRGLPADGDLHPGTVPCCPDDRGCHRPTWLWPLGRGRVHLRVVRDLWDVRDGDVAAERAAPDAVAVYLLSDPLASGFSWPDIAVLIGVCLAALAGGVFFFGRRDLPA